ncbi:hypothetical protein GF373_06435 [bacterium]|nr:hypothetical protein [bacterium]
MNIPKYKSHFVFSSLFLCFFVLSMSQTPGQAEETQFLFTHAHAHNDYEHEKPLEDALSNRFYSVEADIWLVDGKILVSHDRGRYKGSLKELYLDPLQKRVKEKGSVHGDGREFLLWVDIKDSRAALRPVLHNLLKTYPMLSVFSNKSIKTNAVTVILTGDRLSKTAYGKEFDIRYACRDSNSYAEHDPKADKYWLWYAINWGRLFEWDGKGAMPAQEHNRLKQIVSDMHEKGRKVRFYATPETELYWEIALKTRVDLINTDELARLHRFLKESM